MLARIILFCMMFNSIIGVAQFSPEIHDLSKGGLVHTGTSIVAVDINGDGTQDIMVSSAGTNSILLFIGEGGGEFLNPLVIAEDSEDVKSIKCADIDGDGDIDVVAGSNSDSELVWYENLGDGTFSEYILIDDELFDIEDIWIDDINNDSFVDIVVIENSDNVYYLQNAGDGNFESKVLLSSGFSGGNSVVVLDLDGDEYLDIIAEFKEDDRIVWYKNVGDGTFDDELTLLEGIDSPLDFGVADFNNDGHKDLGVILGGSSNKVIWYENDGGEEFSELHIISELMYLPLKLVAEDVDADGDTDVLCAGGGELGKVVWYRNEGDGYFSEEQVVSTGDGFLYSDLLFKDVDNDEFLDIICLTNITFKAGWYKNLGDGEFSTENIISSTPNWTQGIESADLNLDGANDIITFGIHDKRIVWYENFGDTKFDYTKKIADSISGCRDICIGDINGDLYPDIISAGSTAHKLFLHKNLGDGIFAEKELITSDVNSPYSVHLEDLDNDGDLDLLSVSTGDNKLAWYINESGIFETQIIISEDIAYGVHVNSGDLDLDGDADVIVTTLEGTIIWFENYGFADFSEGEIITSELENARMSYLMDVDGDLDLDMYTAFGESYLAIFENDGGAEFNDPQIIYGGSGLALTGIGNDLDMDEDMDIIFANNYRLGWHENIDTGIFSELITLKDGLLHISGVLPEDVDLDGDLDIVFTAVGANSRVSWLENLILEPRQIRGVLFIDENENGLRDEGEEGIPYTTVLCEPEETFAYTYLDGRYFMNFGDDVDEIYSIFPLIHEGWGITSEPLFYEVLVDDDFTYIDSLDFGFYPEELFDSINVELVGGHIRCENEANYWISIQNNGTTKPSGQIRLELDEHITYLSSELEPDSIVGQNIYWHYDSLFYFSFESINLIVLMPDFEFLGDTLISNLEITINSFGEEVFYKTDTLEQILVCSYDPNDKFVQPEGVSEMGYIPITTSEFEYTIRFQNTGTDTAYNVLITDQLDENLNWTSIDLLGSSHEVDLNIEPSGKIKFNFNEINLPDSNINEIMSHGYVKYRVNLQEGLLEGTSIFNVAEIYFDTNPSAVTNVVINTLYGCDSGIEGLEISSTVCLNDTIFGEVPNYVVGDEVYWALDGDTTAGTSFYFSAVEPGMIELVINYSTHFCSLDTLVFINVNEPPVVNFMDLDDETVCIDISPFELFGEPEDGTFSGTGITDSQFNPTTAGEGEHTLYYSFEDDNGCSATDSVIITVLNCLSISDEFQNTISIYPNPFSKSTIINFGQELLLPHSILLYDVAGKEVFKVEGITGEKFEFHRGDLDPGTYIISLVNSEREELYNAKIIIQ